VRAVPRLCELYPGICLTTEEKYENPQLGWQHVHHKQTQYEIRTMTSTKHRRKTVTQSSTMTQDNKERRIQNRENSPLQVSKPWQVSTCRKIIEECLNFPRIKDYPRILDAWMRTWNKFRTEHPQILGTTFRKRVACDLSTPVYFHDMFNPTKILDLRNRITQYVQNSVTYLYKNKIQDACVFMFERTTAASSYTHTLDVIC
jgi:hypothetical protein